MNLTESLLPVPFLWASYLVLAAVLLVAVRRAPWHRLREGNFIHVYLGASVGLLLLWTLKAGVDPGLSFHLLGATLFALMFGWELAVIAIAAVTFGIALNMGHGWSALAVNALVEGVVPALVTYVLLRLSQRWLPMHLFVYIFVNGFFGAALAVLASSLAATGILAAAHAYPLSHLSSGYLAFVPLLMFSEAWLTGMLVALLVCYRPDWIRTFDDRLYLHGK
jgi:uncharacterized membrane protein